MSRAPHNDPPEFQKTLHWREPITAARFSRAAIGSIARNLSQVSGMPISVTLDEQPTRLRPEVEVM